jgi:hypothetical protein
MFGYVVSRPLTLMAAGQSKTLRPAARFEHPTTDEVFVPAQREVEYLRRAVQSAFPEENPDRVMRLIAPEQMATLPGMPRVLGAAAFPDPRQAPAHCLQGQLRDLRAAYPNRNHYRILLVNAFGSNLGDTLIGLAAYRHVYAVLCANLPEISVDVMLGWHKDDRLIRLFRDAPGLEGMLTQGLSLAELSRYQAVFDTSGLLTLPRYGHMPIIDWYLWWMGVDPEGIQARDKRNAMTIPEAAREFATVKLPPFDGPRIMISPKASVGLRTMPQAATQRLVEHILSIWPTAQVVLTQPLPIKHPRVICLGGAIPTVDDLAALVERVDGLIGVDTYTQHVADATATPAVTIYTSVLPERYPYYPLVESVLLPGAQSLPAWGREKVPSATWQAMEGAYLAAWARLDLDVVLQALQRAMDRRKDGCVVPLGVSEAVAGSGASSRQWSQGGPKPVAPGRQLQDPLAMVLHRTVEDVGRQLLMRGETVIVLGAGAGESALALAGLVGRQGRLVICEPRRELFQLLCANIAGTGFAHVEAHCVMPEGQGLSVNQIFRLRIDDEFTPLSLSNCAEPEQVVCWPLDALNLPVCRMLVVLAPLPLLSVLKGAALTIGRLRPVVVAGVFDMRHRQVMESLFDPLAYRVRIMTVGDPAQSSAVQHGILVAEPLLPRHQAEQLTRIMQEPLVD